MSSKLSKVSKISKNIHIPTHITDYFQPKGVGGILTMSDNQVHLEMIPKPIVMAFYRNPKIDHIITRPLHK